MKNLKLIKSEQSVDMQFLYRRNDGKYLIRYYRYSYKLKRMCKPKIFNYKCFGEAWLGFDEWSKKL